MSRRGALPPSLPLDMQMPPQVSALAVRDWIAVLVVFLIAECCGSSPRAPSSVDSLARLISF